FERRILNARHPVLVVELGGDVVGVAWTSHYSDRTYYSRVAECSVYVAAEARGRGIGTALCEELAKEAERRGFYKLLGKLFTTNSASIALVCRCGFRQVGLHRCHGQLEGDWRDVLLVERLLGEAAAECTQEEAQQLRRSAVVREPRQPASPPKTENGPNGVA
ncbi:MAG: N-acetyltransferase, partial [Solirubrobacterales bacterium]|nr:N-acetyltransferase [Solirubrobacterales bacterium]